MKRLADSIPVMLEKSGMTQADLARLSGVSPQQLSNYVRGRSDISFQKLVELANHCGMSIQIYFDSVKNTQRLH